MATIPFVLLRKGALGAAVAIAALSLAAFPAQARPGIGQRVSDCKVWDCQGNIICTCCFSTGCWICDAPISSDSSSATCHWDDKVGKLKVNPTLNSNGLTLKPLP